MKTFDALLEEAIENAIRDEIAGFVAEAVRQELAMHADKFVAIARAAIAEMLEAANDKDA